MRNILLACIALCLLQKGITQTPQARYTLLITNANVVDVVSGKVIPNRLLAISSDTIKAIDNTKKQKLYKAEKHLDVKGKYVLPGLWDMHVHFRGGDSLINANKALLPMFLAHGVTRVRDCGGDIVNAVMEWRKQIKAGTLSGPYIFTSGPKVDGPNAEYAGSLEVQTPQEISKALDYLQTTGADFVKIHDGSISREAYLNLIAEAEKRGMKTTGHIPFTVKVSEAFQAGLDAAEHMSTSFVALCTKEDSVIQAAREALKSGKKLSQRSVNKSVADSYSPDKALRLYDFMAAQNKAIVPTLITVKTLLTIRESDHAGDTQLAYIDPKIIATYEARIKPFKSMPEEDYQFLKKHQTRLLSLIPEMHKAGVNIIAGSDSGPLNAFVYPGESLQQELKLYVAAGLTPAEALRTATINGAKFMGVDSFYGTIQVGKSADMIIINKNPLSDINAIDNISMVLSNRRLYTKEDLNNLLDAVKH